MRVKKFLAQVAHIGEHIVEGFDPMQVYFSNFDNSYITHVDMEKTIKFLADREITDELTHG